MSESVFDKAKREFDNNELFIYCCILKVCAFMGAVAVAYFIFQPQ